MHKSILWQSFQFFLLCILLILIWQIGPSVEIAGVTPLQSSLNRAIANTTLILIWLFSVLLKPKASIILSAQSAQTRALLTLLSQRFQGAIHFLKRTTITNTKNHKTHSLYDLPWYLVIGPPQSGKTSLLANANLSFILTKQQTADTELCDWWVSRDAVFLDTAGQFCPFEKCSLRYKVLWHRLLQLIKQHGRQRLNGIVLVVDLPKLAKLTHRKKVTLYYNIRANLALIKHHLKSDIPTYLVCNQCDRVFGFDAFFSDLGQEEQQQIWGATLQHSHRLRQRHLLRTVKKELLALTNRLHERLLWRLHHERNQQKRFLIKDFPVQVDRLTKHIITFIKYLSQTSRTVWLRGIYFTSSTQQGMAEDYVLSTVQKNLNLPEISKRHLKIAPHHPASAFFSTKLLQDFLPQEKPLVTITHSQLIKTWGRHIAALCVGVAVVTCGIVWSQQLIQHIKYITRAENMLAQYHALATMLQSSETSLNQPIMLDDRHNHDRFQLVLAALNAAQRVTNTATHIPNTYLTYWLHHQYDKATTDQTHQLYQHALSQLLAPEIVRITHEKLLDSIDTPSPDFYSSLEVYLMLGEPQHLNRSFVQSWLTAYWQLLFADDPTAQQQLTLHTLHWLTGTPTPLALDDELLTAVREKMHQQS